MTTYGGMVKASRRTPRALGCAVTAVAALIVPLALAAGRATLPAQVPANEIEAENCLPGTRRPSGTSTAPASANIQGFATDISVDQGQTVDFKVDTPASDYRLDIYRMG